MLDDVIYAFDELGISVDDLLVYSRLVDSTPCSAPQFPLPRQSAHIYSAPPTTSAARPRPSLSEEDEEGNGDITPSHFPPLPSKKMDDDEGMSHDSHMIIKSQITHDCHMTLER